MIKPALILTRPLQSAQRFVGTLPPAVLHKVDLILSPLMQIIPTEAAINLPDTATVIFSSASGVENAPAGQGRQAFCVGRHTTDAAAARGWNAVMAGQDADALVSFLLHTPDAAARGKMVHLGGVHQRGDIAARLTQAGLKTSGVALYDQQLLPLNMRALAALNANIPSIIPLFSLRTAEQFFRQCPPMAQITVVAISAAVAGAVPSNHTAAVRVAIAPTSDEMRKAVEIAADQVTLA